MKKLLIGVIVEALLLKAVSLRLLSRMMKWQHLACLSITVNKICPDMHRRII